MRRYVAVIFLSVAAASSLAGCTLQKAANQFSGVTVPAGWHQGLTSPHAVPEVQALCDPPRDWVAQPLDRTPKNTQQVWLSPTGRTAYGVIRFELPLPVGNSTALWGFLQEMKRREGQATLLSKTPTPDGLGFEAEGGKYRIRGLIVTRGLHGWVTFAGTLRQGPVELDELELAVQARDNTAPGLPEPTSPAQ